MEVEKQNYKIKLCNFYKKHGKCDKKDKCNYAHGDNELRFFKKECINGLKCFKKDCLFQHPKNWDYKNNLNICEYYKNGYCNKEDNCEFIHIKECESSDDGNEIKKNTEKADNGNNEITLLEENQNLNNNELDETQIKDINKDLSPNIEIFVDGLEYNNDVNILNTNGYDPNKETMDLIDNLNEKFETYIKDIKYNIDEVFLNNDKDHGINIKLDLNKLMSEIILLKYNFQDIINNEK
jgi:hypothetical protein